MSDESKTHTRTHERIEPETSDTRSWVIHVAHHSDPQFIGRRHALKMGARTVLGRQSPGELGEGALQDADVSRDHLAFEPHEGKLTLCVLGKNGALVGNVLYKKAAGDAPAPRLALEDGNVVSLLTRDEGAVHLLIRYSPICKSDVKSNDIVYASAEMAQTLEQVRMVAQLFNARPSEDRVGVVLIRGETGSGKELIARAIHAESERRDGPFNQHNCAQLSKEMARSELFGHKKGAFTGATADHIGIAEASRQGTLFLDEVGEIDLDVQPQLLRFLALGEVCRLGENRPRLVDVNIVCASNVDFESMVREGRFREDLWHRIDAMKIHVKPLRQRLEDVPLLTSHFIRKWNDGKPLKIDWRFMLALLLHTWPGNVRELENVLKEAIVSARERGEVRLTKTIEAKLSGNGGTTGGGGDPPPKPPKKESKRHLRPSREKLLQSMKENKNQVAVVAEKYDARRGTVYRWLEHHFGKEFRKNDDLKSGGS